MSKHAPWLIILAAIVSMMVFGWIALLFWCLVILGYAIGYGLTLPEETEE